jgi:hypothetical protein
MSLTESIFGVAICSLVGHTYIKQESMIPADRSTYRCLRCHSCALVPSSVGAPVVPFDQREPEDMPTECVNDE